MLHLNTEPNIEKPDDFYARLLAIHEGRTTAESAALNARLVLILCNHIGDAQVLNEAMNLAASFDEAAAQAEPDDKERNP